MLAPVLHVLPVTTIRRKRLLPAPGKVVVRKGQKVSATDVIGEVNLAPEHQLLAVTRALGLTADEADQHLRCSAGAQVAQGDVLAGPVGFAKRVLRAPKDGRVIVAGSGQILLEIESRPLELSAGLTGTVADLIGERGAVIETKGALIQGVWGNGRIDFGLMHVLAKNPDQELLLADLDMSLRGSVVMGGYCGSPDVLRSAAELPLRGLILSSLDSALACQALRMKVPVIVLQGWGRRELNAAAFKLLSTSTQSEVAINAQAWNRHTGQRPEVVISLPGGGLLNEPPEVIVFSPGQQVHITGAPHAGRIGTITAVRLEKAVFPSGISAQAADIRLENGDDIVVPLANLEVLV